MPSGFSFAAKASHQLPYLACIFGALRYNSGADGAARDAT